MGLLRPFPHALHGTMTPTRPQCRPTHASEVPMGGYLALDPNGPRQQYHYLGTTDSGPRSRQWVYVDGARLDAAQLPSDAFY